MHSFQWGFGPIFFAQPIAKIYRLFAFHSSRANRIFSPAKPLGIEAHRDILPAPSKPRHAPKNAPSADVLSRASPAFSLASRALNDNRSHSSL